MTSLQVIAGHPGGPTIGTNFFQSECLRNAVVHFAIVNNVAENGLEPDPDYTFQTMNGTFTRERNNVWLPEDKLIVFYSKCNC